MENERIVVDEVVVAGRGSAKIRVVSEKGPFRILNMVVDERVARDFFVTDLKVGRNSQLVSVGAIHASYFAQEGEREDLVFDDLYRGAEVHIDVQNASEEPRVFSAVLRGILDPRGSLSGGRYAVAFGSTLVRARTSAKVHVQPQVEFVPDLLVVSPEILESFKIVDLRVVGRSVGLGRAPGDDDRPGELSFSADATKIGDWITVEVVNETDVDRFLYATVTGRRVDYPKELLEPKDVRVDCSP